MVKVSTCRKLSGIDFLLVTIPPIGFMRSTAARNTAVKIRKKRCRAVSGVEEWSFEAEDLGRGQSNYDRKFGRGEKGENPKTVIGLD